ncbi:MAG: Fe(3+) ABC transporter substrate-binding protein [Kiloniellales bacterium]
MSLAATWRTKFAADRRGRRVAMGCALSAVAGVLWGGRAALSAEAEVNLYSYRQEFLIRPLLDAFTEETGIKVNVVFARTGMLERLKAEGENTPADVVLTVDIARLQAIADAGLLQPVKSAVLETNIPAPYRDPSGLWFGLTTRARVIYYAKDRVDPAELSTYEDLADPKWRGRLCARSGKHAYNRALVASMIAAHGEAKARAWVEGLVANFARKPQGNDRAQVKALMQGVCDIALGNTYYMGKMKTNDEHPEQKAWAAAARIFFPNQDGRGTHVNLSGAGVTKWAKRRAGAIRLIEFLSGDAAQRLYASQNFEYPVKDGVAWQAEVASWGRFKADTVGLSRIAELSPAAVRIINQAGWL